MAQFRSGKQMVADPYSGFGGNGKGPGIPFDEGIMAQIEALMSSGADHEGVGTDGELQQADEIMNQMKGREGLTLDDLLATLQGGGAGGRGQRRDDGPGGGVSPQALVEAAMAEKVGSMLDQGGITGTKNMSRIGGLDEPRRKIGKGEQRVNRKEAKYNKDGSTASPSEKKDRDRDNKYKQKDDR